MAFLFQKKGTDSPLCSPGSTYAPSPGLDSVASLRQRGESEESSGSSLPAPATAGSAEPLLQSQAGAPKFASRAIVSYLAAALLVAVLCVLGLRALPSQPAPRLWDPDLRVEFSTEPAAKSVIRKFDGYNMARGGRDDPRTFDANVDLYMAQDMVYESVGFGDWKTPHGWAKGEEHNYGMAFPETVFTQMLFFGDEEVATTTTYGSALWKGDLFGVKAPKQWVTLRITDFYGIPKDNAGRNRIRYNFMMIDWADALRQIGRPVLLPSVLPEGLVLPPSANDGVPAPLSAVVQAQGRDKVTAMKAARAAFHQDWAGDSSAAGAWHEDLTFYGPGGIGLAKGVEAYDNHVLGPFRTSFANRTVEELYSCCEGNYCALLGRVHGKGVQNWLGLPSKGKEVSMRIALHWRVVDAKVQEGWAIIDFPGLFEQLGLNFYDMAAKGESLAALQN
eukprot:TRINITY_DN106682_c0_g1_i1.p1 TRINITY_DN106682_c0_g1~~TRINITY_DN106682_c0_g1_i1.p1  ORF type:complete len:447 (-),score=100.85 TRINITY_DN106682_c0_g1_i1:102-1442(-)